MRWLWWIGSALLLVVVIGLVVTIVGWLLPVGHTASRSAEYRRPPEAVFTAIADVAAYPEWWRDVSRVEMLEAVNGRTRFREHTTSGPIVFEIDELSPPRRMVTRIADPEQPFGGTWTFELVPASGGTRLTITERGEVYNPIFRFMSRFVFSQTATMESYLTGLAQVLGRP